MVEGVADIANRLTSAPEVTDSDYDGGGGAGDGGNGGHKPPAADAKSDAIERCSKLDQNDTDNGKRLIDHFGHEWLHVRDIGNHGWVGTHWDMDGGEDHVKRLAQQIGPLVKQESRFIDFTDAEKEVLERAGVVEKKAPGERSAEDKAALDQADTAKDRVYKMRVSRYKFGISCGNLARTKAMVEQGTPHKTVSIDDMDKDPNLFNVQNGTLCFSKDEDMDSGEGADRRYIGRVKLKPHDALDNISKVAPVAFDPNAKCPKFSASLERFQPDPAMRTYLQVYFGYCLFGHSGEQVFLYNYGSGANFKSTLVETIARLFGNYARSVPPESITGQGQRRGDQASPDIARLADVRLVYVEELPKDEPLKENLVKALTGGGKMTARHLQKGFFEFQPIFAPVMTGNHMPNITGGDHGIWRRVKIVPWTVMIPDAEQRPMDDVLLEFKAEGPGILNWIIEGACLYLASGLRAYEPAQVTEFTADYREEMDPLGNFISSCVVKTPGTDVPAREMYNAFVSWCTANAIRPWKETQFGRQMPTRGFVKLKGSHVKYLDVMLKDIPQHASDNQGGDGYE